MLAGVAPFELAHPGPADLGGVILCAVEDERLTRLAQAVEASLDGVRARTDTDYLTGQTSTRAFGAHLTVAGQDLALRPDLRDEVAGFVAELAPDFPPVIRAEVISAFRFRSAAWPALWWQDMTWQHLRSWRLTG